MKDLWFIKDAWVYKIQDMMNKSGLMWRFNPDCSEIPRKIRHHKPASSVWNLSSVCLLTNAVVLRQMWLQGGFGSGGGMLRQFYHANEQVLVRSTPTLIGLKDVAGPIRRLSAAWAC